MAHDWFVRDCLQLEKRIFDTYLQEGWVLLYQNIVPVAEATHATGCVKTTMFIIHKISWHSSLLSSRAISAIVSYSLMQQLADSILWSWKSPQQWSTMMKDMITSASFLCRVPMAVGLDQDQYLMSSLITYLLLQTLHWVLWSGISSWSCSTRLSPVSQFS